jgi:Carboxypeptidase regulatory-like domain
VRNCWLLGISIFLTLGATSKAIAQERVASPSLRESIQAPQLPSAPQLTATKPTTPSTFTVFPVGINVGKQSIPSTLIRGQEDGSQAVEFEQWLIPFETVVTSLKLEVKSLPDGQLEVRSPGFVTQIDPKKLTEDPELGLTFSIAQIKTLFGVPATFDIVEYAIQFTPSWLDQKTSSQSSGVTQPIQLEGLPVVKAPGFGLTAIEQRMLISSSGQGALSLEGETAAVGRIFGGSWFARVNQSDLKTPAQWSLAEAQYLRQGKATDLVIGSQPTFWNSDSASGDFWGVTGIWRRGFTPPTAQGGNGFSPNGRLQSGQLRRNIVGQAAPGTLVRLVQGFGDRIMAEVLVDSSGVYRFDNFQITDQEIGIYRLLLYPRGQLTVPPETRELTFSTVPGQIPAGNSATIVSAGLSRTNGLGTTPFVGDFTTVRAGVEQRWGVSETLTLGTGVIYDQNLRGLGELFFRPKNIPLEAAISVLSPDPKGHWIVDSNIFLRPSSKFSVWFNSDRLASRLNLNWQVTSQLSLLGVYNSLDGFSGGLQLSFSGRNYYTFARATYDDHNRIRWSLNQRLGSVEFSQQGNEVGILSELTYNLSGQGAYDNGNALFAKYETNNAGSSDFLGTLGWRYRSQKRRSDGSYLYAFGVGIGVGSRGTAPIVTAETSIIPGLSLQGRYQGVSLNSDQPSFSIGLFVSTNLQHGFSASSRRQTDYFRTDGGMMIQPFLDLNNNGKLDGDEKVTMENVQELITINGLTLNSFHPEVMSNRLLLRLPPNQYRLDLDPAGFPIDMQSTTDAYAVETKAGAYTVVQIPFVRSYTLSGLLTDGKGQPVAGARVEAIAQNPNQRKLSITNEAGVYYLEGLAQGNYTLQINGIPTRNSLNLDGASEPLQELNLKISQTPITQGQAP